jgi:hypothetical protein
MTAERLAVDDVEGVGPGTLLGDRYRLLRLVGEGGMGQVFLADDERDGQRVAVKVLTDDRPIPKAAQRFEREARSIARIAHDNVVRVSDVGQSPRGGLYYVMEYLQGEELATTLERGGPMRWPRARHLALQICSALQAAHEQGIVHRDLKLENCFRVERDGDPDFVKILDFGVAKLLGPERDDGERLTNTGATLGTPAYMAPELCRGKHVDHRVDVYALGVMLYELLTGGVPFEGDSFMDVALQHMNDPPPPLSEHVPPADLPDGLEAVVMRALAKRREDRFPTMAAMGRALQQVGEGDEAERAPAPRELAALPMTAPGGTEPALAAMIEAAGGTEPALSGVALHLDHADDPEPRRAAVWPWLVGGAAAAAGLVAWWMAATTPAHDDSEAAAARVEEAVEVPVPPIQPTTSAAEAAEPAEPAEPADHGEPAATTSTTADAAVASSGGSASTRELSSAQIDATLRRVQPRVSACAGSLTGGRTGDRVRVTLKVDRATGQVLSASASVRGGSSAVGACVADVLRKAKFARVGRGAQKVVRTLEL